jgi:exopolysaccharide biosynthesis operon protein EpsL
MLSLHRPCLAAIALLLSPLAWAEGDDALKLNANYTLQTDSNLFRLPASTRDSRPNASDVIGRTSLGLNFSKAYSLQQVTLSANLVDSRFKNNSYLNLLGHDANAAWHWSASPELQGNLVYANKKSLSSFVDNPATNIRNEQIDKLTRGDFEYGASNPWRLVGALESIKQTTVSPIAAEGNTETQNTETGVRYVWASNTSLTYKYRNTNGKYTDRILQNATLLDDGFHQKDNELKLIWVLSEKSTANISAAHINRTHPHYPQRNYSGFVGEANLKWAISGKSALAAGWARDLSSFQSDSFNYAKTDRFSVGPAWQPTPKVTVNFKYELAYRDYSGNPFGSAVSPRSDSFKDMSLSLDWQPLPSLTLSTSLQKSKRTSNQSNLDYDSNMATFSAQYSY